MLLKELFDLSDDEVVENLLLDPRYQYALHTTSFEEQPLSDKSLTRFRQSCYDYEQTHGVDLYHSCINDLASKMAKLMKIDGRIRRMDSLLIEANIRKLSRVELLYRCISKLVTWLHRNGHDDLIRGMEHYYDPNDFNIVIYHCRGNDVEGRMETLLKDSDSLLEKCGGQLQDVTEYQLFVRCLSEQTVSENGKRRMATKEDKTMTSKNLQNPSDPDATFRKKAGNVPKTSSYIRQNNICTASFPKELCANCPHKDQCHAKIFKRVAKITVTKKAVIRARLQAEMKTDVYKNYGRFRNAVETIPSMLRNAFHTDRMPVRGKLRSKLFFGSKIGALNFRKLFRYRKGIGCYAHNPIFE